MIDLDRLARKCAALKNEPPESWCTAVWSPAFQKVSQSMSDGEVEKFLQSFATFSQIEVVIRFLDEHPNRDFTAPFAILIQEAKEAGLGLGEWISALRPGLGFRK